MSRRKKRVNTLHQKGQPKLNVKYESHKNGTFQAMTNFPQKKNKKSTPTTSLQAFNVG